MKFYPRLSKKRIKNWLIYIVVKFGYAFLTGTKRATAFKFLQTLGKLGYYLAASERKKTIANLKFVFGDQYDNGQIIRMAKDVFINLGRNMVDAFRMATLGPHNIDTYVEVQGLEKIDNALAKGNGVFILTGHLGNWELLGAFFAFKGYTLNAIGAPIYDPRLDELVVKNRLISGLRNIARGSATREIIRTLKRNEMVAILIDQDSAHVDGVFVDFLGHEAYTPVGLAVLAMKTGASIVPMGIHIRKNNTHLLEIGDEVRLKVTGNSDKDRIHNTLRCSKAIEQYIIKYPTQWVWMHDRWKTKREKH